MSSSAEIAVRYAVETVFTYGRAKPSCRRTLDTRSIGYVVPASAPAAEGARCPCAVRQSASRCDSRAYNMHGVGQQMLAEGNRLRPLQMRIAGHDRVLGMRLRLFACRTCIDLPDSFSISAGNLLASDTAGNRARPDRSGFVPYAGVLPASPIFAGQQRLDVHVDVLVVGGQTVTLPASISARSSVSPCWIFSLSCLP